MEVSTFSAYIKRGLYFVFSLVFIICVGLFYLNTPARASVPSSNLLWTGYPNFVFTNAIATDSNGNIYVAGGGYPDYDSRIAVYNRSTHLQVATIGQNGSGNGQFRSVTDIAIDSSGNIYVVDSSNNRIQKFNSSYVWQFSSVKKFP